ncbi:helix-turn-helix transcriptional regulator [Bacillus cereus]|nr:helix-turn-helix transcriptional regulator [Bacillus cereus]
MDIKIKEVRKSFGDTLQSLAEKINYDYSNLSKVERGIYTPSLELLDKIAQVYEINIADLLDPKNSKIAKVNLDLHKSESQYELKLDGIQISEDELDFLIQSVRIFRHKLKKYTDNIE